MTVYLDEDNIGGIITPNRGDKSIYENLYESSTLTYGNHTLLITRKEGGSIGINGFAYLDNFN